MTSDKSKEPTQVLQFRCEWDGCESIFNTIDDLMKHVNQHLQIFYVTLKNVLCRGDFECQWQDCGSTITGFQADFERHVYFHVFHVKIKNVGLMYIDQLTLNGCTLDEANRNIIPELPESFHCGWQGCDDVYNNPELFYRHVNMHNETAVENCPQKGSSTNCQWEGCDVRQGKYKLKEHLRSHTQERLVACPTCGSLFSNRTKFHDHLKKQSEADADCYECSHCAKRFTSERLLRDHMRRHVNNYKCPFCDMTCPTPSGLRNHIRYRHSKDRPFHCDQCNFRCKSGADLRKHLETHVKEDLFECHVDTCNVVASNYRLLMSHYRNCHQSTIGSCYACHICQHTFNRGYTLSLHMVNKHKFKWPSGHSRFRYKLSEDGFYRLQTVRYESVDLIEQIVPDGATPYTNDGDIASNSDQDVTSPARDGDIVSSSSTDPSYNLEMLGTVASSKAGKSSSDNKNSNENDEAEIEVVSRKRSKKGQKGKKRRRKGGPNGEIREDESVSKRRKNVLQVSTSQDTNVANSVQYSQFDDSDYGEYDPATSFQQCISTVRTHADDQPTLIHIVQADDDSHSNDQANTVTLIASDDGDHLAQYLPGHRQTIPVSESSLSDSPGGIQKGSPVPRIHYQTVNLIDQNSNTDVTYVMPLLLVSPKRSGHMNTSSCYNDDSQHSLIGENSSGRTIEYASDIFQLQKAVTAQQALLRAPTSP